MQITGNVALAKYLNEKTSGRIKLKDLALKTGLHQSYLSLMRSGKRGISREVAQRLAKALNVDPNELLQFANKRTEALERGPYAKSSASFHITVPIKYATEVADFIVGLEKKIKEET